MVSPSNESDLELENIDSENLDGEITPLEYEITVVPADLTLETLHIKWKNKDIEIPKFQRSYVWNIKQASRLIESFMMGLPIPPIYFFVQSDQISLVIDGMQRLLSVVQFFEGYFGETDQYGKRREFRLEGINEDSRWSKKRFVDFSPEDQRKLKNTVLRTIHVTQRHPESDHTSIYHIFERLNTGGTALQDQEVRNCIYSGKLNDLLIELNEESDWRKLIGKEKIDPRQKDVKLILRYMSLFHNARNYKKPMKDFLSSFMDENRNPENSFIDDEKIRFHATCKVILETLGTKPFTLKTALNPSVFDALFISFANHHTSLPDNIAERVNSLKSDETFQKLTSDATTDSDIVQKRLKITEDILFG